MTPPSGSGWREHLLLFGRFLRHPRSVGAITPSSAVLAEAMVGHLPQGDHARVVELGPGTGVFTAALAARLGPEARLLSIDREPLFIERLQGQWANAECVCESATALSTVAAARGFLPVDHIVSGLPFATLPEAITKRILDAIECTLRPGGTFTTFQYVHAYRLPAAVTFRRAMNRHLGGPPDRMLVLRNFPPAYVLRWSKGTGVPTTAGSGAGTSPTV